MGVLDSGNVALKSQVEKIELSLSEKKTLWSGNPLNYNYLAIDIEITNPDNASISIGIFGSIDNAPRKNINPYCVNSKGQRVTDITEQGIYYVEMSQCTYISLYNNVAAANATALVEVKHFNGELPHLRNPLPFISLGEIDCTNKHDIVSIENTEGYNLLMFRIESEIMPKNFIVQSRNPTGDALFMVKESGEIGFEISDISKAGIYYVDITGLDRFALRNITPTEGCKPKIWYKLVHGKMPNMTLKPAQTIGKLTTIGDGQIKEAWLELAYGTVNEQRAKLLGMFRYFVVHYYNAHAPFELVYYTCSTDLMWSDPGKSLGTFEEPRGTTGMIELLGDRLNIGFKFTEPIPMDESFNFVVVGIR